MSRKSLFVGLAFACLSAPALAGELEGTKPLPADFDPAAGMVAGIHKYLDRELAASAKRRDEAWKATDLATKRSRLRKILGVVDERLPPRVEEVVPLGGSAKVAEVDGVRIARVRWRVLPGVDAEGLHLRAAGDRRRGFVVAIPDAEQSPFDAAGLGSGDAFALHLAANGFDVLVPTLMDRSDRYSSNAQLGKRTNIPHREFVHRMAYEVGRTLVGYEVQKVLAAVDFFSLGKPDRPVGVVGYGEGGRIALYAAALDERIGLCQIAGAFGPQETAWQRPLDRNLFGILAEFGDAELGAMIVPRKLIVDTVAGPTWSGPVVAKGEKSFAAPGTLEPIPTASVDSEFARLNKLGAKHVTRVDRGSAVDTAAFLKLAGVESPKSVSRPTERGKWESTLEEIQRRQFDQLVAFSQKLWRESDRTRRDFWKSTDATSPAAWEKSCEPLRDYFHERVLGKLPEPTIPLNPRTRLCYDEKTWIGYDVVVDVYDDVYASGILLLPRDLKPGDRRPIVVCQHGLEGSPRKCIDLAVAPTYREVARKLVAKGYVVYCPQNPYIGDGAFRTVNRKGNLLQLSLFSFIVRQHQRTLDFLQTLPGVDPDRIGFYGLSYGGKTAMRVPALEKRYKVSVCSGDFNEWIGKMVSTELPMSYMYTHEYEMYEFDLASTFNYCEMAALIAPRAFMVERGHDDGVGTDEMVAAEYAKVRYLYANRLKIPDRTAIEFNVGGHELFLKGSLDFLSRHLGTP